MFVVGELLVHDQFDFSERDLLACTLVLLQQLSPEELYGVSKWHIDQLGASLACLFLSYKALVDGLGVSVWVSVAHGSLEEEHVREFVKQPGLLLCKRLEDGEYVGVDRHALVLLLVLVDFIGLCGNFEQVIIEHTQFLERSFVECVDVLDCS